MRTTITLADDTNAAVEEVMRRRKVGRSEAVNELVRAALSRPEPSPGYTHQSFPMGPRVDVSNIGDVLDLIDQWDANPGTPATDAG